MTDDQQDPKGADHRKRREQTRLVVLITLAALFGLGSIVFGYVDYQTGKSAQREDVLANREISLRIERLLERFEADARVREKAEASHRVREEELSSCLVDLFIQGLNADTRAERRRITNPCPPPMDGEYRSIDGGPVPPPRRSRAASPRSTQTTRQGTPPTAPPTTQPRRPEPPEPPPPPSCRVEIPNGPCVVR